MTYHLPQTIRDNLRFLIVEVSTQLDNLQIYFTTFSETIAKRILDRSGYVLNLKMRIHNSCHDQRVISYHGHQTDLLPLRAMEAIATALERIAELCRDCIHHLDYLQNRHCLRVSRYQAMIAKVILGVCQVERALLENDTQMALKIGRIEDKLDRAYKKLLRKYTAELKRKANTESLITSLFVAQCIEQMGDALLDISEAIMSANLGQPVNIDRYHSIQASLQQLAKSDVDVVLRNVAETRSGSAISAVQIANEENCLAIIKDGKRHKLKEERQGLESWHEIFPGLAPKILSYQKQGQSAALLIEHLAGLTFEQILLHEPLALLQKALERLIGTLSMVWRETATNQMVSAGFMEQLAARLEDVYAIHPDFKHDSSILCGRHLPSFEDLLQQAGCYEANLSVPFAVYIHGDFNADNIIYDPLEDKINFIDLHRSRYMDYVQDVSVFMVSNYRLQALDAPRRYRIRQVCCDFYHFVARFANSVGDSSFELRLALGLARSFATSTRFILDKSLARAMYLRARYLIEQVVMVDPRQAQGYRLPIKELFLG